jgi:hypothetical protein
MCQIEAVQDDLEKRRRQSEGEARRIGANCNNITSQAAIEAAETRLR